MTFREAEERMAALTELGFRTVEFHTKFYSTGTDRECFLYTEKYGGTIIQESSWELAFAKLESLIIRNTPKEGIAGEDQAPPEDIIPASVPEVKDDCPF